MKRVFIIHGWGGSPESEWLPWVKKQLQKKSFEVIVPEMPNTNEPKLEEWIPFLEKIAKDADENSFFIGHSVGCQAIIRFLERTNIKVRGVVLVAPWGFNPEESYNDEDEEITKPWVETPIEWAKVKELSNFVCIFSDNDPYVPLTDSEMFKEKLNSKIIIEHDKNHFDHESGIFELPSAVEEILRMSAVKEF